MFKTFIGEIQGFKYNLNEFEKINEIVKNSLNLTLV